MGLILIYPRSVNWSPLFTEIEIERGIVREEILEDLDDETRAPRDIAKDKLALLVKSVGQYGKHAAAKNAGFQKDDVIVEADGLSARSSEGEWLGHFLQKQMPGGNVKVTVLRGAQRVELSLPMQ